MISSASSNVKPMRMSVAQNTAKLSPLPVKSITSNLPRARAWSTKAAIFSKCVYRLYVSTSYRDTNEA